jgi:hypothetical protein
VELKNKRGHHSEFFLGVSSRFRRYAPALKLLYNAFFLCAILKDIKMSILRGFFHKARCGTGTWKNFEVSFTG